MPERFAFFLAAAFAASPWASPPAALAAGLAFGLLVAHPFGKETKLAATFLLQASVVCLGFGMDLREVLAAGSTGLLWTAGGIAFTLTSGWLLARALKVRGTAGALISVGTAICGGSAIAALGPILGADEEDMSVSLGTVFLLNSVALLVFPAIGRAAGLSEGQFGLWAALSIHDTSSVVGATAKYGATALAVGTTIKLARALWIVPLALAAAAFTRSEATTRWPWFILLFLSAAAAGSALPTFGPVFGFLHGSGRVGLKITLMLIGSGVSRGALARVGPRPLLHGLLLWGLVGTCSLALIRSGALPAP